ncbi:ABC transporter ATP-binding protein [Brachybacterium saurashtrense]|uniref:ABC transporter ATP-binding protein n=1 Tax=Brachybacterium saurashtrense TaxID=556288 RepID=A0A345YT73_9MICO|nr:ABC transporter ATP-binding protein [Brachybacterium saurashtrense]AXK47125.1 ABC transporter ATP-binding protein [Brachybacterium saurashtrense]RRR23447.1 ABC transporter ATP-binding protein [Brachybacterium saurashtrense]
MTSAPRPDSALVRIERVGVVHDGAVLLLEASAAVAAGEVLALTGANGTGKTTLLRVIAGLQAPTAGTVAVLGAAPDERDRAFRAALAALLGPPQTARDLTVAEHLQFIAATWGAGTAQARQRAEELLEELAIAPLAHRYPHELSSGQSQLVGLALTLARPARVLLLDEPEQRLDPHRLGLVIEAVRARARAGTAVVLATHSPRLLEELADSRLHLEDEA